jgi:DNA-binding transcriptional MerR regulator/quercetin dioxygenase-like cupin family protein
MSTKPLKRTELLRIGQVARLVGVSASALRKWETRGLFHATRTPSRYRLYGPEAVSRIKTIKSLRLRGLNAAGIAALLRERGGVNGTDVVPPATAHLAPRLTQLRSAHGFTLQQVAQKTGLSERFLRAIERGAAAPSVAVLKKLASAYDTNVLSFFDVDGPARKLVRPQDRRILSSGAGVQMQLLAFGATQMEVHMFRIAPRTSSGGAYQHQGEEFLYLLEGKLEIWLDEIERYVLEPGDSLYFRSTQSHRWCSLTDHECVLLWINTPPTF